MNFINNGLISEDDRLVIVLDNVDKEMATMVTRTLDQTQQEAEIHITNRGNAGGFRYVLDLAATNPDYREPDGMVYFVEDDYIHKLGALTAIRDGLNFGDYVSLYDHPGHYTELKPTTDPEVLEDNLKKGRLWAGNQCHWAETTSTCMTFASRQMTLQHDYDEICRHLGGVHPGDYGMWKELRKIRTLVKAIPGLATHAEVDWLSPFSHWEGILEKSCVL